MNMKTQLSQQMFANLPTLSADDLDERGRTGKTILLSDFPFPEELQLPELEGGWMCRFVGTKNIGEEGDIVLLPNTVWTRKLWTEGQRSIARAAGLNEDQTRIWINSGNWMKHILLPMLCDILKSPRKIEAMRAFDINFPGNDYLRWSSRSGIVLDEMSRYRRRHLQSLFLEINDGVVPPFRKKRTLAESISIVDDEQTTQSEVAENPVSDVDCVDVDSNTLSDIQARYVDTVAGTEETIHSYIDNLDELNANFANLFTRLDKQELVSISLSTSDGPVVELFNTDTIRTRGLVIHFNKSGYSHEIGFTVLEDGTYHTTVSVTGSPA